MGLAKPVTEESNGNPASVRNITPNPELPIPAQTANLRFGPNLSDHLLALLPLIGIWRGQGQGSREFDSTPDQFEFGQELTISHDGNDYLLWESVIWELAPVPGIEPTILTRETGFLRIGQKDSVELLLSHSDGFVELYYGSPLTLTSWELATDVVIQSSSARTAGGAKRLYGIVDSDLAYVEERFNADGDLIPRYSARLQRWAG